MSPQSIVRVPVCRSLTLSTLNLGSFRWSFGIDNLSYRRPPHTHIHGYQVTSETRRNGTGRPTPTSLCSFWDQTRNPVGLSTHQSRLLSSQGSIDLRSPDLPLLVIPLVSSEGPLHRERWFTPTCSVPLVLLVLTSVPSPYNPKVDPQSDLYK